jgi:hypothetical protein
MSNGHGDYASTRERRQEYVSILVVYHDPLPQMASSARDPVCECHRVQNTPNDFSGRWREELPANASRVRTQSEMK